MIEHWKDFKVFDSRIRSSAMAPKHSSFAASIEEDPWKDLFLDDVLPVQCCKTNGGGGGGSGSGSGSSSKGGSGDGGGQEEVLVLQRVAPYDLRKSLRRYSNRAFAGAVPIVLLGIVSRSYCGSRFCTWSRLTATTCNRRLDD
ncbi:hypothetical protein M0802_011640 [Mischocyttarus mexicanus]|nr:hypothetical protein M0802_011640 [Mischocyttarus mexicanus]